MPLKLKQKQITVEVSDVTVELDQLLTKLLVDAAKAKDVEPDAYVLALIQHHFFPETPETPEPPETPETTEPPEPTVTTEPTATPEPARETMPTSSPSSTADAPARTRAAKGSKPKYLGKLSELLGFGDEGNDIALEMKNKGLISPEQYEAVLNGAIPKGKLATINQDAREYIVEQLTKADVGSGSDTGDDETANAVP